MNGNFKYWAEYETENGEGKARKLLTEQKIKQNLDVNIKPVVDFMEKHMVLPSGSPESQLIKSKHFYIFFSRCTLFIHSVINLLWYVIFYIFCFANQ